MSGTGKLPPQTQLKGGVYSIIGTLGKGGMGAVYQAIETSGRRVVAIKEMSKSQLQTKELRYYQAAFEQEAIFLRHLSHPNLPHFYDYFLENGRPYLVMEFIQGETLEAMLKRLPNHQLPVQRAVAYAMQLCEVLSYLHSSKLIYLDLKPSNIIIGPNDQLHLVDFGIAQVYPQPPGYVPIALGTKGYSPQEQYRGCPSPRSDLYALGATMHCCLTGHNPKDNSPNQFYFHPARDYNSRVPEDVDKLIQWLVATKEEDRPASADSVLQVINYIGQQAASQTANIHGLSIGGIGSSFYDEKTARSVLPRVWLLEAMKQSEAMGRWWITFIVPFLLGVGDDITAWFSAYALPFIMRLSSAVNQRSIAAVRQAFSSRIWTPPFSILYILSFVSLLAGGTWLLGEMHTAPPLLAFSLAAVLLLLAVGLLFSKASQAALARSILIVTALMALLTCISLYTFPQVHLTVESVSFGQTVSGLLVLLALLSLLRPENRLLWVDSIVLALIVALIAALQAIIGVQELRQIFSLQPANAALVNTMLLVVLGVIIALTLLRLRASFGAAARWAVCVAAFSYVGLQYFFELTEISGHIARSVSGKTPLTNALLLQTVSVPDIVLLVLPPLVALIWLFIPWAGSRWGRFSLLVLAVACVVQQSTHKLVSGASPSIAEHFFHLKLLDVLNIQWLAGAVLVLAIATLLRLTARFQLLDTMAVYCIAFLGAAIQLSFWSQSDRWIAPSAASAIYIGANQLLVTFLFILLGTGGIVMLGFVFWDLLSQVNWVRHMKARFNMYPSSTNQHTTLMQWINRIIVLTLAVTSTMFQYIFGQQNALLAYTLPIHGVTIQVNWLLTGVLALLALLALVRISHSFGRLTRLIVLGDAGVCAFALWNQMTNQHMPQFLPDAQRWLAHPPLSLPGWSAPFWIALISLIAFFWLKRPFPLEDRGLLWLVLVAAFTCSVLQIFGPFFLLAALVLCIQSLLLAARIEAVRHP